MNFDFAASATTALSLITKFGQSLTITRISNVRDIVAGSVVATETPGTLTAVVLPAKSTAVQIATGNLDDAVIEALRKGKIRFVLAAAKNATFQPDAEDILTFEGASWRVLGCTPLNPAGTPIVFKIGVMKV